MTRYERLGWLGDGGMGRVEAAFDLQTGQRVALKSVLLPTPEHLERQLREVDAQRQVQHDNVLPVLETLPSPEGLVLVLPWVQGPSLDRLLALGLPAPQRMALFREVVEGVAAIHRAGLVHRDLKPSNVLLDASADRVSVRVSDFGLAKRLDQQATLTQTGEWVGSEGYVAPEQRLDASRVDARADVFALGAILREMLGPGTEPWAELAQQMLSLDPQSRPAHAGEVLARLPSTAPISPALVPLCRELAPEPRARTTSADPTRQLPPERDAFVGRHEELRALTHALAVSPLVSLVGTAGVGKTRLALRHAALSLGSQPGGAYFCDLSHARDPDSFVMAVASALEVPLGKGDPVQQLGLALAGHERCLILLDNLEQVGAVAREILARWLLLAPEARFLVTSREALALPEERVLALEPLAPSEAEVLFRRRAREAEPSFSPSLEDHEAIGALTGLLDHLPLAIELAASRARMLSATQLLARMGERFRLLASPGGRRDRHGTLLAALDWSWSLLSEDEQLALAQLSVFDGGCTEDSAREVLQLRALPAEEAVSRLVQRSLVRKSASGRIELLMSVQQYAERKLTDKLEAEARHGRHFAGWGTPEALAALHTHGGVERRSLLAKELDNLISASRRAVARSWPEIAASTALAAWVLLERRGPCALGASLLEGAAAAGAPRETLRCAGRAHHLCGQVELARQRYEEGLAAARARADRHEEGMVLLYLGILARDQGKFDESRERCETSLQIARSLDDLQLEGLALNILGALYKITGQTIEARENHEKALAIFRASGDRVHEGVALNGLAIWHKEYGDPDVARSHFEQAVQVARELGDRALESSCLTNLGAMLSNGGGVQEARALLEEALRQFREMGMRMNQCVALVNLAVVGYYEGRLDEARASCEEGLVIARELGYQRFEGELLNNLALIYAEQGRTQDAIVIHERVLELHRGIGARQSEANSLFNLGVLYGQGGEWDRALVCLEDSLAISRELGDRMYEGVALAHVGNALSARGQLQQALACYEQAIEIAEQLGNPRHQGHALGNLGKLYSEMGRWDEARAALDRAAVLTGASANPMQLANVLVVRACMEHGAGDLAAARQALAEAERLAAQIRNNPLSELGRDLDRARRLLVG